MSKYERDPSNYGGRRTPEELIVTYAELLVGLEALRMAGVGKPETKKNLGSNEIHPRTDKREEKE